MDFAEYLQEDNVLDLSSQMMKHAVISTVPRPTANPWSGD
jgi:hypothetical protein